MINKGIVTRIFLKFFISVSKSPKRTKLKICKVHRKVVKKDAVRKLQYLCWDKNDDGFWLRYLICNSRKLFKNLGSKSKVAGVGMKMPAKLENKY